MSATAAIQSNTALRSRSKLPAKPQRLASPCSTCFLQGVCLPCTLEGNEIDRFGNLVTGKRRVARGSALFQVGDELQYVYAVCSGAFKTVIVSSHGDETITGFHLAGDLMGLEAISGGRHGCQAIALENSEACAIPFAALSSLALALPQLQQQMFRMLSSEITRDQGLIVRLGSMTAEQRLAAFLLSLSSRYQRLGFAADRFVLRMTREEIGSYLGLTLETVSRLFSRFQQEGLLVVRHREVTLDDIERLRRIAG
jgi:CRP/FNR family transcriptional regulator